jgi:hypothetical protein
MYKDDIIQVEYINEAKIKNIITRNNSKLLNKKNLPVANIPTIFPVIPEKEYTYYRVRIHFLPEKKEGKNYTLVFSLFAIYLFYYYIRLI